MKMNVMEKASFDLRLDLQRISTAFSGIYKNRMHRLTLSMPELVMNFVLVQDEFLDKIQENASKIPFSNEESYVAHGIIHNRVYSDGKFIAAILTQEEIGESDIWETFTDFTVLSVNNPNMNGSVDDDLYIEYPSACGYGSRGSNCFRVEIYDMDNAVNKKCAKKGNKWFVLHRCCKELVLHGNGRFMRNKELIDSGKYRMTKKVPVRLGKAFTCSRCGEVIYFTRIAAEDIFSRYRLKVLHHDK